MGNVLKSTFCKYPALLRWKEVFEMLELSERLVGKFYREFRRIDVDASCVINIDELTAYLGLERTVFTSRLFGMFDNDNSHTIDVGEFIVSLWNYCTLERDSLVIFTFDLYDEDGSGELDAEEVAQMLSDVYGPSFNTNKHAQSVRDTLLKKKHVTYDRDTFAHFAASHPALLFPAFMMQNRLQSRVMGVSFWNRMRERRSRKKSIAMKAVKRVLRHCSNKVKPHNEIEFIGVPSTTRHRNSVGNSHSAFSPVPPKLSYNDMPNHRTKRLSSAAITASSSMYTPRTARITTARDLLELCDMEISNDYESDDETLPSSLTFTPAAAQSHHKRHYHK